MCPHVYSGVNRHMVGSCTCSFAEIVKTYRAGRELIFRLHKENALVHSTEGTQGPWWGVQLQARVGGRKTFLGYKTQSDLQPQKEVKVATCLNTVTCYYTEASSLVNWALLVPSSSSITYSALTDVINIHQWFSFLFRLAPLFIVMAL